MSKGSSLEHVVIASQRDVIRVEKIPSGVRWIGKGKTVPIPSPVDFMGVVVGVGRGIVFDAKQSALKQSYPVGNRDHFPAHQRERIVRHGMAGAIAGLLVEATALREFRWLDWPDLLGEVPSIKWDDPCWVKLGPTSHTIDFRRIPGVLSHPSHAGGGAGTGGTR